MNEVHIENLPPNECEGALQHYRRLLLETHILFGMITNNTVC